ncbi:MAG: ABC transporter ATP-binding protein [Candidatus Nanopelagicales bacterium]|nr:ABC transporter ATP-binding protein [Candidatus Nanopelagicales bacterium]MDZ4250615.1 ABC transporter ATP-binding protein [Candidatus Nanopelagicales bacterium]
MIQLEDVTRAYRLGDERIEALSHVNLSIDDGDFVAIMGPSGSGKTTLANVIGGLDRPTSGRVVVEGRDLSRCGDAEMSHYRNQHVGFVFQNFNLHTRQTAERNVMLPLVFAKVNARERTRRARAALEKLGMGDRLRHRPNQLSSGQRQRVAIARALVNNPRLVIADEPTGNLDSKRGAEIMDLFVELNNQGVTLLVITHDSNVAARASRTLHIQDGRVSA